MDQAPPRLNEAAPHGSDLRDHHLAVVRSPRPWRVAACLLGGSRSAPPGGQHRYRATGNGQERTPAMTVPNEDLGDRIAGKILIELCPAIYAAACRIAEITDAGVQRQLSEEKEITLHPE